MKDLVDVMFPVNKMRRYYEGLDIPTFRCSKCGLLLTINETEEILAHITRGFNYEPEDIVCFHGEDSCQAKLLRKESRKAI